MKAPLLLVLGVLGLTATGRAQDTVITSAPTIEAAINQSATNLNATLTQLLNEAELQNQKLQTSLDRMGDPSAVNLASISTIKDDIRNSATSLKTEAEQRTMMTSLTGAEVFEDDALGVMEPIGTTVTLEDGSEVDRDPEKYRMEAAMLAQVKEYKRVREEALERKTMLTAELAEVLQDLEDAQDLASIQKLNGMITILRGQIEEVNQSILIAQADSEMTEKELVGHARVISKSKSEKAALENESRANAAAEDATFPGFGSAPRSLPWGRKGSETNPEGGTTEP